MSVNVDNINELKRLIIHSKSITPQAKGFLGIILFKIENKINLDSEEKSFLDDMISFLQVS